MLNARRVWVHTRTVVDGEFFDAVLGECQLEANSRDYLTSHEMTGLQNICHSLELSAGRANDFFFFVGISQSLGCCVS